MSRLHWTRGLSLAVALSAAAAARADDKIATYRFEGTVGDAKVGATLVVRNDTTVDAGHYFYKSHLQDIPLSPAAGDGVSLTEPSGGAFALRFVGNGSEKGQKLNFYNSVGLAGEWTAGDRTLPVRLGMLSSHDGPDDGPRYEGLGASDSEIETRVRAFVKAALAHDPRGAARQIDFPLRVNLDGRSFEIANAAALKAKWDVAFSAAWRKKVAEALPHDMDMVDGMAMLADGAVYFTGKGAKVINATR